MGTVSSTCNTPTTTNPSIPLSHKNCRFDMTDGFCDKNEIYTRTTDIKVKFEQFFYVTNFEPNFFSDFLY